jgi:uncharacterized RDD family membrane protein YckC
VVGAQLSGQRLAGGQIIARLGDRLIALALDTILGGVAFAVIGMYVAVRLGGVTESGFSLEGTPALAGIGCSLLIGFLYYWLLEGICGATLGKAIVGLRVRDKSGARCGLKPSLIRNVLRIIDALGVYLLGFFVAVFSGLRQRLGDHLAGTVVVENPVGTVGRAVLVVLWLALVGGGSWLAYAIHQGAPRATSAGLAESKVTTAPMTPATPPEAPKTTSSASVPVSGDLSVVNFSFLQGKDGPVRPQAPYKTGDKVFSQFEVAGFTTDADGRVHLLFDAVPLDPNGLRLYENWQATFQQALQNPKEPVPTTFNFDIPGYAPAGTYKLQIKVHDAVKKAETEFSQSFTVETGELKPATQLEVHEFQFSRSEGGPSEPSLAIQAGGTVYMAFKVAGMQFREDRPDVNIAMRVIAPGGEVLLERANLVQIRDAFTYHPPTFFKQITSWVTLPSNARQGRYTVSFTVADQVAQKTINHDAKFEVR